MNEIAYCQKSEIPCMSAIQLLCLKIEFSHQHLDSIFWACSGDRKVFLRWSSSFHPVKVQTDTQKPREGTQVTLLSCYVMIIYHYMWNDYFTFLKLCVFIDKMLPIILLFLWIVKIPVFKNVFKISIIVTVNCGQTHNPQTIARKWPEHRTSTRHYPGGNN